MFQLSTKARYGLRIMLDLAIHHGKPPVLVSSIAERQALSPKYVHNILTTLRNAGLVRAVRGPGGGFVLSSAPCTITVNHIVRILEGPLDPVDCVGDPSLCNRSSSCIARDVWCDLGAAIERTLSAITLGELASRAPCSAKSVLGNRKEQ